MIINSALAITALLATIQISQPKITHDLLNEMLTATITFDGDNTCNGGACPVPPNPPSPYDAGGGINISNNNVGSLTIEDGGVVIDTTGVVGVNSSGNGSVTVTGSGSEWNTSGKLTIGDSGDGTLNIENGGVVSNDVGAMADNDATTNGTVNVTGTGSEWNNSGELRVGNAGVGILNIDSGGVVNTALGDIGNIGGSNGTVNITDSGSQLNSSGELRVGNGGTGEMNVENGALVTDTTGDVGNIAGSSGVATVTDTGSRWSNSNQLRIGKDGNGTLNITNGALITVVNNTILANDVGSAGTLNLNDSSGNRGILETRRLIRGAGTDATVNFNGGILRANSSQPNFINGFNNGELNIQNNGLFLDSNGFDVGTSNVLAGVGNLTKQGAGTLTINGVNSYSGGTIVEDGTLLLVVDDGIAASSGVNLTGNTAALSISPGSNQTINDFTGVAGSQVNVDGNLSFGTANSTSFDGSMQGNGDITKQGNGTITMNGNSNSYNGQMTVTSGTLDIEGQIGGNLIISAGSSLIGNGKVGNLTVNGTISPGNSIGVLTINGNYTQTANSTYVVEINPQGQSDLTSVLGNAQIAGTVQVLKESGSYNANTTYTILHADGGVTGTYSDITQFMPYLVFLLNYDANNVYLLVSRSVTNFADLANTPNEIATANAVESLGLGNPVYNAVANLMGVQEARQAFNSLSGEMHASILGTLAEETRFLRYAVLNRLQTALADPSAVPTSSSYLDKFGKQTVNMESGRVFWADGFGSWGDWGGDRNAASLYRRIGGIFIGADQAFGETARLGVVGGYSQSNYSVSARNSYASSNNYYLGTYAGMRVNQWSLRLGGSYTWDDMNMNRNVSFSGFSNYLTTNFEAHTGQLFAEAGYNMKFKKMDLEPFAGAAYVNIDNMHWNETGGSAALHDKGNENVAYSAFGIREAATLYEKNNYTVNERILLAWQHAYNNITPQITQQFALGGIPFLINGVPIARNSLLVDAGLNWTNNPGTLNFRLSYIGQLAGRVNDNGVAGILTWRFS